MESDVEQNSQSSMSCGSRSMQIESLCSPSFSPLFRWREDEKKRRLTVLERDVSTLKEKVSILRKELTTLKSQVESLDRRTTNRLSRLQERVNSILQVKKVRKDVLSP